MAIDYTKLREELARNADVVGSTKALLQKFLAELEQAANGLNNEADQKVINDLTAEFTAQTDDLANAVATGTVADPTKAADVKATPAGGVMGGSQ